MQQRIKWQGFRSSVGSLSAALVLAACGGGVAALVSVVTPLGGQWSEDDDDNESLRFTVDSDYFSAKRSLTAVVHSLKGVCGDTDGSSGLGTELEGALDNGQLSLHQKNATAPACMEGEFVDLARLRVQAAGLSPDTVVYENGRVDIGLSVGLWTSEDGKFRLKFEEPDSVDNDSTGNVLGCDVSGTTAVNFSGTIHGLDSVTRADPFMPELRRTDNDQVLYGKVEFVHGAELLLDTVAGDRVVLHRQPDTTTSCP